MALNIAEVMVTFITGIPFKISCSWNEITCNFGQNLNNKGQGDTTMAMKHLGQLSALSDLKFAVGEEWKTRAKI